MTASYARLCLPFLVALMLEDGLIDPRRIVPEAFGDPDLLDLASRVRVEADDNANPNALRPQSIRVARRGRQPDCAVVSNAPGDWAFPLTDEQCAAKRALARELAGDCPDPRIFDDPLAYFTEPR
jgi:2-methylcitrate dehydratase PrpD